ncbi:hypothetical protein [Streptomyces goshikiensis]
MLLTDADPGIRSDSVRAFAPPADLLPGLLADPATRAAAVAYAVPTPELAADPDSDVREAVAAHPDLPPGLRDLLAADQDVFVRNAIAARPGISRRQCVNRLWPRWSPMAPLPSGCCRSVAAPIRVRQPHRSRRISRGNRPSPCSLRLGCRDELLSSSCLRQDVHGR